MPSVEAPEAKPASGGAPALPPPTDLKGREDREDDVRPPREVLGALTAKQGITPAEANSALEWFLSEDPAEEEELTHTFELNVGTPDVERWISWTVKSVDQDVLRRIQRFTNSVSKRNRQQDDLGTDMLANIQVVAAGTVDPDLKQVAMAQGVNDIAIVLRKRFQKKPGLIGQIAAEVMRLSGFDDADVREAAAAQG